MINERYQVSAVPIDGGDRATGYYRVDRNGKVLLYPADYTKHQNPKEFLIESFIIDPATIEPVKVKPIKKWVDGYGEMELCPNCIIIYHRNNEFCHACGMAIDLN